MLPAPRSLLYACADRWRPTTLTAIAAALIALGCAAPALAQDEEPTDHRTLPKPGIDKEAPVAFEADTIEYRFDDASNEDQVVASGDVVLRQNDQSVRSDTVTWNRNTGEIVASGNVRLIDQDGNQFFAEQITLTEELKTGAMQNMLLALREGGRLAASSGERMDDGKVLLKRAAYTGCQVEDLRGCPKTPSWRVIAQEVVYDPDAKRVRFKGARLEMFGTVQLPLPGLNLRTDGGASSGLLVPDFRSTPSNGIEVSESYYWQLQENRDLTATAHVYTDVKPMASVQYRALGDKGAYQITGYATESSRIPITGGSPGSENDFRGYIYANGRFQLTPNWSVTGSLRRATDRTFLRRYDISRDDRLRSMIDVERISSRSYLSIAGWATQTMRTNEVQGQVPVALPAIDYRLHIADPVLDGRIEIQANSLAILRSSGQDTQRAFAGARWDLRKITGLGQEVTFTALVRGDVYHSDENDLTLNPLYSGNTGWETRGIATAAVDVKWPLVGNVFGGTQVLTPRVQLVANPPIRNLAVPNEDARAVDLEDSNLFALNRFPGYDRVEDGVRVTYGFDWRFERPRWRLKTTVGQSVRLTDDPTPLPDGTGLTHRTSDIVGRTEIRYRDFVNLTHRFRIDKDNFTFRRNEFDATIGDHRTYLEVGYVKLNRDISQGAEDLLDREEARAAARVAFARYWSLFGSAVVNLTDRKEDPRFGSDGFQPLRTRLGAAYQDDCLELALTWRRDYVTTGDARRGNTFQIYFAFRNLGFR